MLHKVDRWMRSKKGITTLGAVLALLLIVAVLGQFLGWWQAIGLTGSAGMQLQPASYPKPVGDYTCFPSCDTTDGKWLVGISDGLKSFGGANAILWVAVPGDYANFELGFFDGDSGKDNNGNINYSAGNWDTNQTESTYILYADPLANGEGMLEVGRWGGNQMDNNKWWTVTLDNIPEAMAPSRHYFYRLEVTTPVQPSGSNRYKVRSNAYLNTGEPSAITQGIPLVGGSIIPNDLKVINPQFVNYYNQGPSTYTGDWQFSFYVPNKSDTLTVWDGDFDRGTNQNTAQDTDDSNTQGKPAWAGPFTMEERAGLKGAPADDNVANLIQKRSPAVMYEIIDPLGSPLYTNNEPSGTEEWERFVLSTKDLGPSEVDQVVSEIKEGHYVLHIKGLDAGNYIWLKIDKCIASDPINGCGPTVWNEGMCPRTIGYWKNNVRKVYINNSTKGVQESVETLDAALRNLALASPLYRNGLVEAIEANPTATTLPTFANPIPLSPNEAHTILQKQTELGNSMLGRALQQNLATWLNLTSGKIGPTTVVSINVPSGTFNGTLWDALQEAQNIMTNGGNVERAKDIADMINNRSLTAEANEDKLTDVVCPTTSDSSVKLEVPKENHGVIPPDQQPPKHDKMPKAPKPQDPGPHQPEAPADPNTCGARANSYGVEITNNPFYGIKFNYQSGTEVKDSDYDLFTVVIPSDQAASIQSLQMEAKAGEIVGMATIEACAFNQPLGCDPVVDDTHQFSFAFQGATDNGNGTMTLTFQVQNFTSFGLSHATIGLPDGLVPSEPGNGSYESKVCPQ